MKHIHLLGDSVFDNGAYTARGPDVIKHVRGKLPSDWKVTLLAVDGNVASDVERQLSKLPPDATHLAVSAGGNDALQQMGFLQESAKSVAEVLLRMSAIRREFDNSYQKMLNRVLARARPTLVATAH